MNESIKVDDRWDYGEERIATLGRSEGKILYVVYTWCGDARRIISARRAMKDERRAYLAIYP
ncbi:BrnT family toxin [bacterium]|nr:BrnT family toxin [bacterium]